MPECCLSRTSNTACGAADGAGKGTRRVAARPYTAWVASGVHRSEESGCGSSSAGARCAPEGVRHRVQQAPTRRVPLVEIRRAPWIQDSSFPSQLAFSSSMSVCRQAQPIAPARRVTLSVSGAPLVTKRDLLLNQFQFPSAASSCQSPTRSVAQPAAPRLAQCSLN